MNQQKYENTQKKLGCIHSFILRDVKRWLDDKVKEDASQRVLLYDIRKFVENRAYALLRNEQKQPYPNIYNCMAFPVGVNKNSVAAHYSPCEWESEYLNLRNDSVSIDFGLFEPTMGVITDGAFTWNGSECHEGKQLSKIAEEAVDLLISKSGSDVILGELGADCQEFLDSKEVVLEGKETRKRVKPLKDLCGHAIAPYVVHAGKAVPSIGLPSYTVRMKEGETYAVEVFPTTGSGESYEVSLEEEIPTHIALTEKVIENIKTAPRDYVARMINIVTTRKCVPFHPEWYNLDDRIVKGGIQDKMWNSYPTIKTKDGSLATQWEKLIKINSKGPHLLLQAAPQSR